MPDRHENLSKALSLMLSLAASRTGLTLRDMMEEHSLGKRTLQRMLKAISQACPTLEEVATEEREKRWRMRPSILTRSLGLTATEIAEVEAAAKRLSEEGFPNRAADLRSAAAKLRSFATAAELRRAEPDVEVLLSSEGIASRPGPRIQISDDLVSSLRQAILANRIISLEYQRNDASTRRYHLEPYALLYGRRPYLLARRPGMDDVAVWRLDRILEVVVEPESFVSVPGFDVDSLTKDCFGIWREPPFDVALRFAPAAATDARCWRFHNSQRLYEEPDGSLRVEFRAGGIEEMALHLAGWGDSVTVITPEKLRDRLAQLGGQLVAQHGRSQTPSR